MLELYHNDMSTCAQKVRFAMAEKGVSWQSRHLDLRARDHQTPEYLRLNPNAVVPTIVHDGTVIIESTVINEYIDDAFPGPALRPADAIGRARMRLWTKQLDEGLHADTGVLSTSIAVRYQKLEKGADEVGALINNVPEPAKRERVHANITRCDQPICTGHNHGQAARRPHDHLSDPAIPRDIDITYALSEDYFVEIC